MLYHRSYTHTLGSCEIKAWTGTYFRIFLRSSNITKSQSGQLSVDLIVQLVEHCTGVAEVMGSNPVQAWIFFTL